MFVYTRQMEINPLAYIKQERLQLCNIYFWKKNTSYFVAH